MIEKLVIGRIRASHGIRGEVKVQSISGEDSHIRKLKKIWLRLSNGLEKELTVRDVRGVLPNLIMAFEEITSPEQARSYRGAELLAPREQAAPLKEGEYYIADLVGCEVVFESTVLGTVTSVWENSNCDMLEVSMTSGETAQLPLQDEFVLSVDIDARRIELKVDWIFE
jgi:16S rRNA processing protein RimM